MVYQLSGAGKCSMLARMNPSKVIGLVALAEKPGLGEALRIMRRELSRHGLGSWRH